MTIEERLIQVEAQAEAQRIVLNRLFGEVVQGLSPDPIGTVGRWKEATLKTVQAGRATPHQLDLIKDKIRAVFDEIETGLRQSPPKN